MKNKFITIIICCGICISFGLVLRTQFVSAAVPAKCTNAQKSTFFGLPTWYKYLEFEDDKSCDLKFNAKKPTDYYLVGLAVLEMLLVVAGILAVVFVVVGGYKYTLAQGNPEKITNARQTIQNAVIGVIIAVVASRVVAYLATKIS